MGSFTSKLASLAAGLLLECNWVTQDANAADETVDEDEGQEITSRQTGSCEFFIGALILAMDTAEQLRQYIDQIKSPRYAAEHGYTKLQPPEQTLMEQETESSGSTSR